jgi:hypothetical protein
MRRGGCRKTHTRCPLLDPRSSAVHAAGPGISASTAGAATSFVSDTTQEGACIVIRGPCKPCVKIIVSRNITYNEGNVLCAVTAYKTIDLYADTARLAAWE